MEDQVTPQQFLVFLFALACGVALACGYWYWAFGTGPVAWALAFVRFVKSFLTVTIPDYVEIEPEPPVRTTSEPAEPDPVLADANHVEPVEPAVREPDREPVNLRQLPKQDLIVLLAVQRNAEGKYTYSSNEITSFVGGTAADVKKLIAEVRDEKPAEQAARLNHLPRPANGWGN